MNVKYFLTAVAVAVALSYAVVTVLTMKPRTAQETVPRVVSLEPEANFQPPGTQPTGSDPPSVSALPAEPSADPVTTRAVASQTQPAEDKPIRKTPRPPRPNTQVRDGAAEQPVIPEPAARAALALVGIDPDAEDVWIAAINDPNLPPDQRRNLIEDLNEDGFPDPKNITSDDLPLIVSRIGLIEDLVFDAMDDTNFAAFAEAYKDLINMFRRVTQ